MDKDTKKYVIFGTISIAVIALGYIGLKKLSNITISGNVDDFDVTVGDKSNKKQ